MLALLSNLNLVTRIEVSVTAAEQDTALQGFWMTPAGEVCTSGQYGWQIWTEANRSMEKAYVNHDSGTAIANLGAGHFSPDATDTTQLTLLYGKYRALTNMFEGDPAVGAILTASANGLLIADASPDEGGLAVCTATKTSYTHIGSPFTCIEFVTL